MKKVDFGSVPNAMRCMDNVMMLAEKGRAS